MNSFSNIFIDFVGLIILFLSIIKNRHTFIRKRNILLCHFGAILGLILLFDGIGWYLNTFTHIKVLTGVNQFLSFAVMLLEVFLGLIWCCYIRVIIYPEEKFPKAFIVFIAVPVCEVIFLVIANIFTKWIYYFNDQGYQRGKFFWFFYILYSPYIFYLFYMLIKNAKDLKNKKLIARIITIHFCLLLAFVLQICFYGIPVIFVSFALAVIYLNMDIEHKEIVTETKEKKLLVAHTFGDFYITYGEKLVKFKRKKSLELLAYLIDKKGHPVSLSNLIYDLYEKDTVTKTDRSIIHNLISDIKSTFAELGISDFFIKEYNSCRINKDFVYCDYFELLNNNEDVKNQFSGMYMSEYYWAEETTAYLTDRFLKK